LPLTATRSTQAAAAPNVPWWRKAARHAAVAAALALVGCGASPRDRALSGAGIGAGAGMLGGALIGMPAAGAALGAATGAGVGAVTASREQSGEAAAAAKMSADHSVTNYVSTPGDLVQARNANFRTALRTCGGRIVLIDERGGADANGAWLRLVYGCLAQDVAAASGKAAPSPR
jgi:osmotically inducible lipoprotein OsmB